MAGARRRRPCSRPRSARCDSGATFVSTAVILALTAVHDRPSRLAHGGGNVRLGNGGLEWTFYAWNPRGEANQTCVDTPQGFDIDEDDEGIAVLDYSVQWTITRDAQYGPAYDGC